MSFLIYLITGFAAGIFGGMGMGGGTILIPALTIICGVEQKVAQAANLIAFLPMAAIVLPKHKRNGYLRTEGAWLIILPALIASAAFSYLAAFVPQDFLRRGFGLFLIALALKQVFAVRAKHVKRRAVSLS